MSNSQTEPVPGSPFEMSPTSQTPAPAPAPIVPDPLVSLVCRNCGSDEVVGDAVARWDIGTQSWDLINVFDNKTCDTCGYEQKWLDEQPVIADNSIWIYKGKQYQVNTLMLRNLIQDPDLDQWRPTVRYTTYPQNGLVFYRADTEFFRKFSPLEAN